MFGGGVREDGWPEMWAMLMPRELSCGTEWDLE